MTPTRPSLLVLVRHGLSERNMARQGNVFFPDDESRRGVRGEPDHRTPLTDVGASQALEAGRRVRDQFGAFDYFLASGTYYGSFYYVADFSDSDPRQMRFFDFLSHAGYIVRRRPVKVIRDQDTGERIIKGNLDTKIVLDMLNTVTNYDVAFLFSGDSDFERAVDLLRSRGKRLYVVTARAQLSRELAYVADKPIFYLEDHRQWLVRDDRGPTT